MLFADSVKCLESLLVEAAYCVEEASLELSEN